MLLDLGCGLVASDDRGVFGTVMWWLFGDDYATVGMIMIAPDRQGRGFGRHLMERAFAEIGSRQITLNATKDGLPLYAKIGFQEVGMISQHQGFPNGSMVESSPEGASIRALRQDDLLAVTELDSRATGWSRGNILHNILNAGKGLALEHDGNLVGYALYRRFGRGHLIGPVVADNKDVARALIGTLLGSHGSGFLRIDAPSSDDLSDWLASCGLTKVDDVVTMSRGATGKQEQHSVRVFALASQALG